MTETIRCPGRKVDQPITDEQRNLVERFRTTKYDEPLKDGNYKLNDLAQALSLERNYTGRGGAEKFLICMSSDNNVDRAEAAANQRVANYRTGKEEDPEEYGSGFKAVEELPNEAEREGRIELAKADALLQAKQEFQEQCYLISKMRELAYNNARSDYQYKNFTVIKDNEVSNTLNKLVGPGVTKPFRDITSYQVSSLVPKLRVSYLQWKGDATDKKTAIEKEYKFQGLSMRMDVLQSDFAARGKNIGIRSFSWDFQGTDPFTASRQITATLVLFGDSLRVFEDKDYETLLYRAGTPKPEGGFNQIETKVEVGWSGVKSSVIDASLLEAVKRDTLSFSLTLNSHTFNFGQDGSFELELTYNGRIETALHGINLLAIGDKLESKITEGSLERAKTAAKTALKQVQARRAEPEGPLRRNPTKDTDPLKDELAETNPILSGLVSDIELGEVMANLSDKGHEVLAADIATAIEKGTLDELAVADVKGRTAERYSLILSELEKLGSEGRLFSIGVRNEELQAYFEEYGGTRTKDKNKLKKKPDVDSPGLEKSTPENKGKAPEVKPKPTPSSIKLKPPEKLNMRTIIEKPRSEADHLFDIPYVFFGDIIDVIAKVAKKELADARVQFLLGNLTYKDRISGKRLVINLADVPISIRTYSSWFHENYVKKLTSNVPLSDFINKMITEIISPALGRRCFEDQGSTAPGQNRVGIHHFNSSAKIKKGRVSVNSLSGKLNNSTRSYSTNSTKYNYVLVNNNTTFAELTGDPSETSDIPFLYLGRDKGLLLNATFSKVNNPDLRAHLITKETGTAFERAREPYNVDVDMIGNNIFIPGMRFFLTPTIPGNSAKNLAKELGLGGYYIVVGVQGSISPGSFQTSIRGRYESSGGEKAKKSSTVNSGGKDVENTDRSIKSSKK